VRIASRNSKIPFCQAQEKYLSPDSVIRSLLNPFQDLCNQTHWKSITRTAATYSFSWVVSFEKIKLSNYVLGPAKWLLASELEGFQSSFYK